MTSANVLEYEIINKQNKTVGYFRWNFLCKERWQELLKYSPIEDHEIIESYRDMDEEVEEEEPVNLREFLIKKGVKI